MRTLGRMMIGILVLGLVAGWILRPRVARHRLPWLVAAAYVPALVHGVGIVAWSSSVGVEALPLALYGVAVASILALAWWWTLRTYPAGPFTAPLAIPAQAFVQVAATSLLGRSASAAGAAVDILPGVALVGASVALAAALVVILPTREHFPRLGFEAPRWWRALGRATRRRR